eukprot:4994704-Pyramimonas_sp.AAC.1
MHGAGLAVVVIPARRVTLRLLQASRRCRAPGERSCAVLDILPGPKHPRHRAPDLADALAARDPTGGRRVSQERRRHGEPDEVRPGLDMIE